MEKAIDQNPSVLVYASRRLRRDQSLVSKALTRNGESLQYAEPDCQGYLELVLLAMQLGVSALKHIPQTMDLPSQFLDQVGKHKEFAEYSKRMTKRQRRDVKHMSEKTRWMYEVVGKVAPHPEGGTSNQVLEI